MDAPATIGFGLVGAGMVAETHAKALAEVPGARLVGVAGRSEARTREFAARHGVAFSTLQVEELVARPDVHAVCIATPSGAHLGPALAAIRAGKHLLIEKPIEITVARAETLLRAAEVAGVTVAVVFQGRFGPGARALKAAVSAGRFGRLVLCRAAVPWHRSPEYYRGSWRGTLALDGGGALINQGSHAVDLLQWFVGLPEEVFAWKARRVHTGIEAEDTACAVLRFADGALGTIEASTAISPGWQRRHEICGELGSALLEDDRIVRWDFRGARPEDEAIRAAGREEAPAGGAPQIGHQGHRRQIEDLAQALREGRPPAIDGREGLRAVALIEAIYASAASGAPVRL